MNRFLVILWTTILFFGMLGVSGAITISNYAIVDGTAYDNNADGTFDSLNQTDYDLSVRQFLSPPLLEDRALLEFDISSFSLGDTINSVSFVFDQNSYTSSSTNIIVSAYAGDGFLNLFDATMTNVVVGSYDATSGNGIRSVDIAAPFLQSIVGTFDYLGLRFQGGVEGVNTQFVSIEGAELLLANGFDSVIPHLDINYNPVPEPATMLLFGAGLVGLAGFGRKKFKK